MRAGFQTLEKYWTVQRVTRDSIRYDSAKAAAEMAEYEAKLHPGEPVVVLVSTEVYMSPPNPVVEKREWAE